MFEETTIVFQNDDLVVVDKPTGLSIHNVEDSVNLIESLSRQLARSEEKTGLFPVHRLDKETSGIQIFARDEKAAAVYASEFQSRNVGKTYVGVVRGSVTDEAGTWSRPLTDRSESRVNPAGLSTDRIPCETKFVVSRRSPFFSLCEFELVTGRQHQIRKHAALGRHALVGDRRYGDKTYNDRMFERYGENRMFLHCRSIAIRDLKFSSPDPAAFQKLFERAY